MRAATVRRSAAVRPDARRLRVALGLVVVAIGLSGALVPFPALAGPPPLRDVPVIWWENDRHDTPEPAEREPSLGRDMFRTTAIFPVGRAFEFSTNVRRIGGLFGDTQAHPEAGNVNTLDEIPNSTWFTNRIGLYPMSAEEVARGAGGQAPDPGGAWTIVRAKTEGVTPGFTVRDAHGHTFLIKFDPPDFPRMSSATDVIVARLLHCAGYNVPQDFAVRVHRDNLVIGEGVEIRVLGVKQPMRDEHIDEMFSRVARADDGSYWAIASRYLDGKPAGPFDYRGRRKDDPNDRMNHEHRRELRGLGVIAGWVNHYDTKQANSLDMWVEGDGGHHLRHYLIDFASTLGAGAGADGPQPKHGYEFGVDAPNIFARLFTLGLFEDPWRRLALPEGLPEVGYWEADIYRPDGFEPLTPNSAFGLRTDRDGYWAAKIVSAFRDEHIRAACAEGDYSDPRSELYVGDILIARRDLIARCWFQRICPVDFFRVDGDRLVGTDLGLDRGIWTAEETRYRVRVRPVDSRRRPLSEADWRVGAEPAGPLLPGESEFVAYEFQVDRGEGWGRSVTAYWARASRSVVAVDR